MEDEKEYSVLCFSTGDTSDLTWNSSELKKSTSELTKYILEEDEDGDEFAILNSCGYPIVGTFASTAEDAWDLLKEIYIKNCGQCLDKWLEGHSLIPVSLWELE